MENNKRSMKKYIGYIMKLLKVMWEQHPVITVISIALTFCAALIPVAQVFFQKKSVDILVELTNNKAFLFQALMWVLLLNGTYVINNVLKEVNKYQMSLLNIDVSFKLKRNFLEKMGSLPISEFENSKMYDKIGMAKNAIMRNSTSIVVHSINIIATIITLTSLIVYMTITHWLLPLVLFISVLPSCLIVLKVKKDKYRLTVDTTSLNRKISYIFDLFVLRPSLQEIKLFQLKDFLTKIWGDLYYSNRGRVLKQMIKESKGAIIGNNITIISATSISVILVWQILLGQLTIGDYVALVASIFMIQSELLKLGNEISGIYETSLYISNYYTIMEKTNMDDNSYNTGKELFPNENFREISLNNVSFRYNESESIVLKNINLTINRGEKVVIVGENGAGKSTLVNCLLGLYKPTSGEILINNKNINEYDKFSISENIVPIVQNFMKYKLKIRDNIAFGNLSEYHNDTKILEMINKVGLTEKIKQFPDGIDSYLGREFNNGQELSGGQWQRISLARSLMRNGHIYIFDEPTSALDPIAELEIVKLFLRLTKGKTSIFISHRLGPTRFADKIIVLKKGEVVEIGTHDELLSLNGEYTDMYNSQAAWYDDESKQSQSIKELML